ncbi:hypothetical protein POG22_08735 [Geitlerinema sp. CS-897]|nr:hypothetical protein [Geitlerinema sp. CS-897]
MELILANAKSDGTTTDRKTGSKRRSHLYGFSYAAVGGVRRLAGWETSRAIANL